MARRHKKIECGDYVREVLYSCPEPRDSGKARADKSRATSKAQQRVNQNNSKIKLAMLIGGNFGADDLLITPTFSPEHLPATYAEMRGKVQKYFELLRRERLRRGDTLQYIYAIHHGEKVRWHFHGLVNAVGPDDWELIKSLWTWGDIHIKRVCEQEYSTPDAMAGYLLGGWEDRPNSARAWCSSTNLKKTVITTSREYNRNARLVLPDRCELMESDAWCTQYGSFEYISYFRMETTREAEPTLLASRELLSRGAL